MINNLHDEQKLNESLQLATESVELPFGSFLVHFHTNSKPLRDAISAYYKSYQSADFPTAKEIDVYAFHQACTGETEDWKEVVREKGKTGGKEAFIEVPYGRWIRKVRTGMLMLQRVVNPVVVGPCEDQLAQVVNFINNQFINYYLREGYILGHASAFVNNGKATVIAASSGGGKSSLMLRFLENDQNLFLSNDRVMMKRTDMGVHVVGVAKMPRVNPGTLIHADRLRHLLSEDYQKSLLELPKQELWELEDKYDVQIEDEYGPDRVVLEAELAHVLLLDWSLSGSDDVSISAIDVATEPRALSGLQKRQGPFYQDLNGNFPGEGEMAPLNDYVDVLSGVTVFSVSGRVDMDGAVEIYEAMST